MTIKITPLAGCIGATITGIDASDPVDDTIRSALRKGLDEHIFLLMNGQELDEDQQIAFASAFGPVLRRPRPGIIPEGEDANPAIMLVTNVRKDGEPIGSLPDGEMYFHHDTSYVEAPHLGTFLYAIKTPTTGGHTQLANMYAAYDAVPDALKEKLAGKTALNIYSYELVKKVDISGDISAYQHYSHPVFIRHPRSGRTALYVSRLMTARIDGMDPAESDEILEQLFEISERPEFHYEHVWSPGDLIIWDNLASIHARTDFPDSEVRMLRRCTIEGVRPEAA